MFLVWLIFGAVVGTIAARTRGFSTGGGFLGGAVLGLFAVGLFLVPPPRSCPHCGERIRVEALVCKHCHRDVPPSATLTHEPVARTPMTAEQKRLAWGLLAAFLSVVALSALFEWLDL